MADDVKPKGELTDAEVDELEASALSALQNMSERMIGAANNAAARADLSTKHYDLSTAADIAQPVESAIVEANRALAVATRKELEARKMLKPNSQVTMRVHVHSAVGDPAYFLFNVAYSIRWADLESVIRARCGEQLPKSHCFFWCTPGGQVVEISSQAGLSRLALTLWCSHPWVMHTHESADELAVRLLAPTARRLFLKYDVNGNGRVERRELLRLLSDLQLERLDLPEQLIERFTEHEFARLDSDGSQGVQMREHGLRHDSACVCTCACPHAHACVCRWSCPNLSGTWPP